MKRYLRFLQLAAKFDLYHVTAYPVNFFFAAAGKILRIVLMLIFFHSIALAVPSLSQWNQAGLYILAATFYITDLIASILFHRNLLFYLPYSIVDGSFDRTLIQPVPKLFHTAFQRIDIIDLVALVPFVYFWYYIGTHFDIHVTPLSIALYIMLIINAEVFIFALTLLVGSLSFWTIRGDGLGRFIDHVTGTARFPLDIYPRGVKELFFYIFPLAMLATIPTQALLNVDNSTQAVYVVFFTLCLSGVSYAVWRAGVRRYDSASS